MKKNIILLALTIFNIGFSQVGINTVTPNPDSVLDIYSNDKGLRLPNLFLTDTHSIGNVGGLVVYNSNGNNPYRTGMYFSDGISWSYGLSTDNPADVVLDNLNNHYSRFTFSGGNTGQYNITIGQNSLNLNTSGNHNISMGHFTLQRNTSGNNNIAFGNYTLRTNSTGNENIGFNNAALRINTSGSYNIGIGQFAAESNTIANYNIGIGAGAIQFNRTGNNNIAFGLGSLNRNISGNNSIAFGYIAGSRNTTDHNIYLGSNAGYQNNAGIDDIFIGDNAGNRNTSGNANIAVGFFANVLNTTGHNNLAFGYRALYGNRNSSNNIAFGTEAFYYAIPQNNNIGFGYQSLQNIRGTRNIAFGLASLRRARIANDLIAIGAYSQINLQSGSANTSLGLGSLSNLVNGSNNVAFGRNALLRSSAGNNSALGDRTFSISTVNNTYQNSTAIGYQASITTSNRVRFGNSAVTSIGGIVGWTTFSDRRIKSSISTDLPGINFVKKLKPVTYRLDYKKIKEKTGDNSSLNESKNIMDYEDSIISGFIAQDIEKASKSIDYSFNGLSIPANKTDMYGLNYMSFTPILIKTLQEQNAILKTQEKQIEQLEKIIKKLEAKKLTSQEN